MASAIEGWLSSGRRLARAPDRYAYGYLFPEELDHLADRLDRLHTEAAV